MSNVADIVGCPFCGQLHAAVELGSGQAAWCTRCRSRMAFHPPDSLRRTLAFTLAALLLYIPANLLPILKLEMYGASSENTVISGVIALFQSGDWPIAAVVFLASVLIPFLKLLALFFLAATAFFHWNPFPKTRTYLLRAVEVLGRWAMLDVFVVAVLVSLVKLQGLATILPGPGLITFSAVVVCTILASESFDSHLIWREQEEPHE